MRTDSASPLDGFYQRPGERLSAEATLAPSPHKTVIYAQDGETAIDLCDGPNEYGECPRALAPDGRVQCAGLWLGAALWKFKTAEDAVICPLASIGLA